MNNILNGLTGPFGSNIYPDQGLNTTPLHPPSTFDDCAACAMVPQPTWALGSCESCSARHRENPRQYFTGRKLGDIHYTEDTPIVLPNNYPPRASQAQCNSTKMPPQYGASWQFYNTRCSGPPLPALPPRQPH